MGLRAFVLSANLRSAFNTYLAHVGENIYRILVFREKFVREKLKWRSLNFLLQICDKFNVTRVSSWKFNCLKFNFCICLISLIAKKLQ